MGESSDDEIELTNEGSYPIEIELATNNPAFVPNPTSVTITPGQTVPITITFAPLQPAEYNALLTGIGPHHGDYLELPLTGIGQNPFDLNYDNLIDIEDLKLLIDYWYENTLEGDLNGDGIVDILDIQLMIDRIAEQ